MSTKKISIHSNPFTVKENEFKLIHTEMTPLRIREGLSELDREISFLKELTCIIPRLTNIQISHGGYVPISVARKTSCVVTIILDNRIDKAYQDNVDIINKNNSDEVVLALPGEYDISQPAILRIEDAFQMKTGDQTPEQFPIIIGKDVWIPDNLEYTRYRLPWCSRNVYVNEVVINEFLDVFQPYIKGDSIQYDNLINLLIMVKDAGKNFRTILESNLPFIDRWTILDTGSTDNTVEIIKEVMSSIPGELFQESFLNFRDSRNRLIELAEDTCVFNIILDDTYVLHGNVREFLTKVRGDDVADSYSLFLKESPLPGENTKTDYHITYSSNRIIKPERKLKYVYTIHEIIQSNKNILIPIENAYIVDYSSEYMKERTTQRKLKDLADLETEYKNNPDDPRSLYYIAETYMYLEDWKNAYKYYELRSKKSGYREEIFDSLYKMAVISERDNPWGFSHQLYLDAFSFSPHRSESLFMIGKHYSEANNPDLAYLYLKRAYEIGYPKHENMNLKIYMHEFNVPSLLLPLCYSFRNFPLGEECARKVIKWQEENGKDTQNTESWLNSYRLLNALQNKERTPSLKKKIVFVAPGGWDFWDGNTLVKKGLGGSETFVIKYAEYLALFYEHLEIIVFCHCKQNSVIQGVTYLPVEGYCQYISNNIVDTCFVNRYPVYLFPSIEKVNNVYLVLHDLVIPTDIIPISDKLKNILCISEWHKQYVLTVFPQFAHKTEVISYGVDLSSFPEKNRRKYSFIYSSFPNRGLVNLLKMFPRIVEKYPEARLNIFCDVTHPFAVKHNKEDMEDVKRMLNDQSKNVFNHGWVPPNILKYYWSQAHIWFYPCIFQESCCLTAYEASASRTLAITSDLSALTESVGDRGIIISGNARSEIWQNEALSKVFSALEDGEGMNTLIEKNYLWIQNKSYDIVVKDFYQKYLQR